MIKDRVAAIVIKNKKILLVTGYEEKFYWTPGGKVEKRESHENCLKRELKSELNIEIISLKHYVTCKLINEVKNQVQKNHYYLIQTKNIPKPSGEITKMIWRSKQDFLTKKLRISKGVETYLIPKLLQDNIL